MYKAIARVCVKKKRFQHSSQSSAVSPDAAILEADMTFGIVPLSLNCPRLLLTRGRYPFVRYTWNTVEDQDSFKSRYSIVWACAFCVGNPFCTHLRLFQIMWTVFLRLELTWTLQTLLLSTRKATMVGITVNTRPTGGSDTLRTWALIVILPCHSDQLL